MRPDSPLANRILGIYYLHIGEYENAVELSLAGLQLLTKLRSQTGFNLFHHRNAISATLGTAYVYYQAPRHFDQALDIFDKIIKKNPNHPQTLIGKALIYKEQGKVSEACNLLRQILVDDSDNISALVEMSWCQILLGKHEEGRTGLDKCLTLATKDDPYSRNLRADICWKIGKSLWDEQRKL